jgi:YVTN family beta-propeller protein
MNPKIVIVLFFISLSFFISFFTGCATTEDLEAPSRRFSGQLTLFLNGPEEASQNITFELLSINIIAADGTETEVTNRAHSISAYAVKGRQILLGETRLPAGKYEKLQIIVREATMNRDGRVARLALPPEGIETGIDVTLRRDQNTTLFLQWNADASIQEEYLFSPQFTLREQGPELSTLLIYVTNEGADNVSVINRQSGDIAATIMVGKRPRGIVTSRSGDRLKVYVANAGSNSISVIDPTINKVEKEIPIRFGREPVGIAVTNLPSEREILFVTNHGSDTVSVVDAFTGEEMEKIDVGRSPIAIAVDPPLINLARARFLSMEDIRALRSYRERFFNVYVANEDSNDVSLLRMDRETAKNVEVTTLKVEWRPVAVHVDYTRGKAYVANYDSDKLSVIDIIKIAQGSTSDAVSTINNLGSSIIDVIADPAFDRIYLLKDVFSEIMIIRPFTGGLDALKTIVPPVMGTIPVGSGPRAFILDPEGRKFYVVNRGSENVSVIDKTTKREEGTISVGISPYEIAVFPK